MTGQQSTALRSYLVRGTVLAGLGRTSSLFAALAVYALLARLLSPAEVGLYFLLMTVVTVASTCGQLGLPRTTVRLLGVALADQDPGRARAIVASALRLALIGGIGVALLLAGGPGALLMGLLSREPTLLLMILVGIWSLARVMEGMSAEIFRGYQQIGRAVCFNSLLSSGLLIVALWLLLELRLQSDLLQVVAAAAATVLVVAALGTATLEWRVRGGSRHGGPGWRQLLGWSWPVLGTTLLVMIWEALGLWILSSSTEDAAELALYGSALNVSRLVIMPLVIANAVLMPVIARLHAQKNLPMLTAVLRFSATVTSFPALLAVIALMLAGDSLLGVVFGSFYSDGALLLSLLAVAQFLNVCTGSCGLNLIISGRQRTHLVLNVLSVACLLVAGVVLTASFGALGMAIATLLGSLLQQTLFLAANRWQLGIWTCATLNFRQLQAFWRALPAIDERLTSERHDDTRCPS